MRVRELMTDRVVTLLVTSTLDLATDIMHMARVRHLPVVDERGALLGIVSQRDLYRAAISSVLAVTGETQREWLVKVPVHEVMTRDVVTIGPDASVVDAIHRLMDGKFGCLPVVEGGTLVGLLSETDCLRCFRDLLVAGRFRDLLC